MIFDQEVITEGLRREAWLLFECSTANLYEEALYEMEQALFVTVMKVTNNNQSHAARLLGMNRGTLRTKLKKYNLIRS